MKAYADMLLGLKLDNELIGVMRTFNNSLADAVIVLKSKISLRD